MSRPKSRDAAAAGCDAEAAGWNAEAAGWDAGDAWFDAAGQQPESIETACLRRAAHWYTRSLPELTGLTRVQTEKRLKSLETRLAASKEGDE